MSLYATVTVTPPNGRTENLACGQCGRVTHHQALSVVHSFNEDGGIYCNDDYLIVQCGGCRIVTFAQISTNSEEYDHDEHGIAFPAKTIRMYPGRIVGRPEIPQAFRLPHNIYRIYRETHSALCNDLPILAGAGIRAIVEAVCGDRNAHGRNLEQRIDSLAQMNLITPDAAKILHSLRFMGNDALHETRAHDAHELSTAFEVAEYLLKGVYIIPAQAKSLPGQSTLPDLDF